MLRDGLEKYFAGKVTQEYVIELAFQLDNEFYSVDDDKYDPDLKGLTCELSDFLLERYSAQKTPKEIDTIFRAALDKLNQLQAQSIESSRTAY